jgi:hypothetical protein
MPLHRGDGGCGDGRLKRRQPATGPGDVRYTPERRRNEVAKDGPAEAPARAADLRPGDERRADSVAGSPPPARAPVPGPAWEDRVLDALSSIMAESTSGPGRAAALQRLYGTLPTLSLKLRLVETLARDGAALAETTALGEALAADVEEAPVEALARERRLLKLLLLATRHGKLTVADVGRRLGDDRVMVRLLRSAVAWTGGDADGDPLPLAWTDLRRVAGVPLLRSRILQLAASATAERDAWERLLIEAAARGQVELDRVG